MSHREQSAADERSKGIHFYTLAIDHFIWEFVWLGLPFVALQALRMALEEVR